MSQNRILRDKNYSNYKPPIRAVLCSFIPCHNQSFLRKTLLSVIALGCEPNAAWISLLTSPSPNRTKLIHLPSPHMGTFPWSTLSYLVTWLNLWALSLALQFFLSPSLTISPVPEFLYPATSYSHPQSPTRPECWSHSGLHIYGSLLSRSSLQPGLLASSLVPSSSSSLSLEGSHGTQSWPCFIPAQSHNGSHCP